MINYDKSEASFSIGVYSARQGPLLNILHMRLVDSHGKYLGIPTIVERSKKSVFAALKDRIWKKLQGSKENILSRAGKEVLIKSFIQAIPTYATYLMGVYKLPLGVISDIQAIVARFWWGNSISKWKVH